MARPERAVRPHDPVRAEAGLPAGLRPGRIEEPEAALRPVVRRPAQHVDDDALDASGEARRSARGERAARRQQQGGGNPDRRSHALILAYTARPQETTPWRTPPFASGNTLGARSVWPPPPTSSASHPRSWSAARSPPS